MNRVILVLLVLSILTANLFLLTVEAVFTSTLSQGAPTPPPSRVSTGALITHNSGGTDFTWSFNCGGRACQYGTFVNGDYWVVPIDDQGNNTETVTITNITPEGTQHGAEVNPKSTSKQGIVWGYNHYDASLNLMTLLPYEASPGDSIFKAETKTGTSCPASSVQTGCINTDDVLTILGSIPQNNGATVFRPPFHGDWKPLYTTDKVRFERLPSMQTVTNKLSAWGVSKIDAIVKRWRVPHYDTTHNGLGQFHRATAPTGAVPGYAADQATAYIQDLITIFATQSVSEKAPAVYALLQKGIDVYGIFRLGIPFSSGAGQHQGRKPALAFFAALYDDLAILNEVRGIATNDFYLNNNFFQEDSQLRRGPSGMVVWTGGGNVPDPRYYWSGYFGEWSNRMFDTGGADRNGANGDPYLFIDGPGGGPSPTARKGRNYQACCAAGTFIGFALAQHLMPWLEYANGDEEIIEYADRYYRGRNIDNFDGGFWSGYDECAPADPRESRSCEPWRGGQGCLYYGITWGPDPHSAGQCIKHDGNPYTDGRWRALNGSGGTDPGRIPTIIRFGDFNLWDAVRDCTDPLLPGYGTGACAGLGQSIPGFTPYTPTFDVIATSGSGTSPSSSPSPAP